MRKHTPDMAEQRMQYFEFVKLIVYFKTRQKKNHVIHLFIHSCISDSSDKLPHLNVSEKRNFQRIRQMVKRFKENRKFQELIQFLALHISAIISTLLLWVKIFSFMLFAYIFWNTWLFTRLIQIKIINRGLRMLYLHEIIDSYLSVSFFR